MDKQEPTKQTIELSKMLIKKGIDNTIHYNDGHKTVDIAILRSKIYIEVDGLQHYTSADQIERDFKRDHYSDDASFHTIHIPNLVIEHHCESVASAIAEVVKRIS